MRLTSYYLHGLSMALRFGIGVLLLMCLAFVGAFLLAFGILFIACST